MSAEPPTTGHRIDVAKKCPAVPGLCDDLAVRARTKLAQHCHFHHTAACLDFDVLGDTLVVRGRVTSFYLKQMVQTVLRDLEGVRWVDNQIEVVSNNGFSGRRKQ